MTLLLIFASTAWEGIIPITLQLLCLSVCLYSLFLQMADSYNFKLGNITLVVMFYLDSFQVS